MDLQGRRVTVMGLGHFGGGIGAVQFLIRQGALVTVTDLQTAEQLSTSLSKIDTASLAGLVLGEHQEELFTDTDLVVASPAVKPGNPYLQLAIDAGIPVTSEIGLFWERCQAKTIVVTGTTGKSTVATLLHACLQSAGWKVHLGGNLGVSLLSQVDSFTPDDWVILELSSFQLAALESLNPRPDLTIVTNLAPNHLDWHGTYEDYEAAKQVACAWQTKEQIAVLNADDPALPLWPTNATVIWFGRECWRDRPGVVVGDDHLIVRTKTGGWKLELSDLAPTLQAPHGLMNAAAVLAAAVVGLQVPIEQVAAPLLNYAGLPHRRQVIAEVEGRTFINDSKATTPEATIAALTATNAPVILIVGGRDKGADLTALAESIQSSVKAVVCIGDVADTLSTLIHEQFQLANAREKRPRRAGDNAPPAWIAKADTLEEAVHWAWTESSEGDAILLSPACASHSEFAHYEQRGERFAELVKTLQNAVQLPPESGAAPPA